MATRVCACVLCAQIPSHPDVQMLAHADILLAKPVGPGKIDCKIEEGDAGTVFQVKIFKLEQLPEHCS